MRLPGFHLGAGCLLVLMLSLPASAREQGAEPALELRPLRGPRADVAALLLGSRETGSLRATGLAVAECGGERAGGHGRARVDFWIELESASLLATSSTAVDSAIEGQPSASPLPSSLRLELYAYAVTPEGEVAGSSSRWVRLPVVALEQSDGVKLLSSLDLPAGAFRLRVLVREAESQRFTLRLLDVAVADAGSAAPSLLPPIFEDTPDSWLLVGDRTATAGAVQSALPVLAAGAEVAFGLAGCRLSGASLEARLLDGGGEPIAPLDLTLVGDGDSRRARIHLPDLESGIYLLEVAAESPQGRSAARLPVFVGPASAEIAATTWASAGRPPAESGESSRSEPVEIRGSSKKVEQVVDAYRRVLRRVANGALTDAAQSLYELENDTIASTGKHAKAVKWLTTAQDRVANDLVRSDPECLVPVLLLHLKLHDLYVARGEPTGYLINAVRTRVRALAQLYAAEAKSEMASALAAASLARMATVLERAQQFVSALTVLREALALDMRNPDVVLDLAHQLERHGFREEAAEMLEWLLEVDPRSDEGRLRLALTRSRNGDAETAAAMLRRVTADGASDWVLTVAYQELASYYLRQERFGDAVEVLEAAVQRLPSKQGLYIQLAYALDRTGQRRRAGEVIGQLPEDDGTFSPRLLYRLPPREGEWRSRDLLTRHATARLPQLALALEGTSES